jgi:hypothetical protein
MRINFFAIGTRGVFYGFRGRVVWVLPPIRLVPFLADRACSNLALDRRICCRPAREFSPSEH